jgi:hypothetical protein
VGEAFELSEQAAEWVRLRAEARGTDEVEALAELLELGFAAHRGGGNGARLKELGLRVHGNYSDDYVDVEGNSGR